MPGPSSPPIRARRGFAAAIAGVAIAGAWLSAGCAPDGPRLVERPAHAPDSVVVRNVAVLDVVGGRTLRDRDVLIRGDRIAAIGVGGGLPDVPGATVIDGRGATLAPGLVDSHGHVSLDSAPSWEMRLPDVEGNLLAYLYAGVTTVLDPGDSTGDAVARRDAIAKGEVLGPTIFTAGRLATAPDGHPIAMLRVAVPWWLRWYAVPRAADEIATTDEAEALAARRSEEGVDFLKLVVDRLPETAPRMDADVLEAAVRAAHARGLRSVAHIGDVRDAHDSGRAGVDAWVHGVYKERIPDEQIEQLAAFGIPMVPTLVMFDSYASAFEGPRASTRLERETVPAELLSSFDAPPDDFPLRETFEPFIASLARLRSDWVDNVRRLHDAGVVILAGSDTQSGVFPGAGLHRELALLSAAGLSNAEVIRAATFAPARFLTASDDPDFGQVAVGKRADLLLVDGDPLEDLDALAAIRHVILGGVPLERRGLTDRPTRD